MKGLEKRIAAYYEQCVGCLLWFPFDQMSYYTTDLQWMCEDCASKYNNWQVSYQPGSIVLYCLGVGQQGRLRPRSRCMKVAHFGTILLATSEYSTFLTLSYTNLFSRLSLSYPPTTPILTHPPKLQLYLLFHKQIDYKSYFGSHPTLRLGDFL